MKSHSSIAKMILVIVIIISISTTLGTVFYLANFKKSLPIIKQSTLKPIMDSTTEPTPDINISSWNIYRNKKAGFYLSYPEEWGSAKTEEFRKAIVGKGEEFYVIFANNNFSINGNTIDFEPYENIFPHYSGNNPFEHCKELEKQVFSIDGCKKINENMSVISYGFYLEEGMFGSGKEIGFLRQAFINNKSNKYTAITISFRFSEYQNDQLINMSEDQIRDIAKNQLAKIDKKTINIFDRILSTFEFIEN